ncbi:MAG: glycoside hydrolase family 32 protein [Clostridiales bacterium]|nr:glycoside hydrolase family 32 protein [Clostridiales bacterium]
MKYHYSRKDGWLGNPCGLVFFKDRYHLFFQLNPDRPRFGPMHWGHIVSEDLISWEECPVAVSPSDELSCNSGCATVQDGRIWLFYTSVSHDNNEKICAYSSDDGISFTKSGIEVTAPFEGTVKFRDPFVFRYGKGFRMLAGAGRDGVAKVLQYRSEDLINWEYTGELISDPVFGSVIEAPCIVEADGRWIFIIQSEKHLPTKVLFATGIYDGERFVFDDIKEPFKAVELGSDFYNPVTYVHEDGRVILMGWLFSMKMNSRAISCPREISVSRKGEVCLQPAGELRRRIVKESRFVSYASGRLRVQFEGRTLFDRAYRESPEVSVLEDVGTVEVFLDGGKENISVFIC